MEFSRESITWSALPRNDPVRAEALATTLGRLPNVTLVALDEALGYQAQALATQYGLRGADAVYAAVAQQAGSRRVGLTHVPVFRRVTHRPVHFCGAQLPPQNRMSFLTTQDIDFFRDNLLVVY